MCEFLYTGRVSAETLTQIKLTRLKINQATFGLLVEGIDGGKKVQMVCVKEHFKMFLWLIVVLVLIAENRKEVTSVNFSFTWCTRGCLHI